MPRTVAELLGEASNRDEILSAFFAFARQFFDYTALFVVQDDLAEGREAHGPGATTAEIERISLTLEAPGVFAETRRLGMAQVASLDANDTDRVLAARLRRPAGAPCVVIPLSIRRRVVLILHGDRSGEPVALEELPELLAVVPRVGEAFERLILRRKVGRAGETQMPEPATTLAPSIPRAAAIPVDAARALAAIVGAGATEAPGPRAPDPSPTPAVTAGREPPFAAIPEAKPLTTDVPVPGVVAARTVPGAAEALAMLGVPRSAPPPPKAGSAHAVVHADPDDVIVEVSAAPPDDDDDRDEAGDDAGDGDDPHDVIVEVSAAPPDDDDDDDDDDGGNDASGNDASGNDASGDDDERATSPGRVTAPGSVRPAPSEPAPARRGGYSLHDVREEVVDVRGATARRPSSAPPARRTGATAPTHGDAEPTGTPGRPPSDRASRRHDPRRDGTDIVHDERVHVGSGSEPPLTRDTRPDSPTSQARRRSAPPAPGREPSVIVDMGDQVEALLDELGATSPDGPPTIFERLLRIGDAALPALVQRFPGGLWFDRHAPHTRAPRGQDVSAIARALLAFRERAAPYLPGLLDASEREVRYYATLVAAELLYPSLVAPLGRRLFDPDAGTRVLALDVIKAFAHFPEYAALREELRSTARVLHRDLTRRRTAIRALAELRDAQAVPMLLAVLDDDDEGVRGEAHRALIALTRQDFGLQRKRWEPWAEKHARAHRVEWLIDALLHDDEALRAAAGDELKRVTQEYYGYHPASPRRERERVHRKYQQWWQSEGRARF